MAKKLLHGYTFIPSSNTVVIDGIYRLERFLLITNVTRNEIIFTFGSNTKGTLSYSIDTVQEKTTIVLDQNCSSMSSTDKLQIFIEADDVTFSPAEPFVDPVSKFRVSQPENLIDTDFEYGLQSTKWETLEMVKNIPTFFSRNGDTALTVESMTVIEGSETVTVVTTTEHSLIAGSPIIVQGSQNINCNGAFVVTSSNSNTFQYRAKVILNFTGSILDTYTQVFSGSVYQGTEFKLSNIASITTDSQAQSILTVSTEFPTNFNAGTSFFLSNSISKSINDFDAAETIPENFNAISLSTVNNAATGESGFALGATQPYQYSGSDQVLYFTVNDITVDTVAETIQFSTAHGLADNTPYLYIVGEGNGAIGGLASYTGYFVRVVDTTTIYLTTARNGTTRINLTDAGPNAGVMRSAFIRAYKAVSANTATASESITFDEPHGFISGQDQPCLFFNGTSSNLTTSSNLISGFTVYYPKTVRSTTGVSWATTVNGTQIGLSSATANSFMIKVSLLNDRSSIYFANHGLTDNNVVIFGVTSGIPPTGLTSSTSYRIEFVNPNRVRLKVSATGVVIRFTSTGTVDATFTLETRTPNLRNDTIFVPNTNLIDGAEVIYTNKGNTSIGGLVDNTAYYVFQKTQNRIKLASNSALWKTDSRIINQATGVNLTTDVITTAVAHGFTTGDAVQYLAAAPLSGLANGAFYWARVVTATTLTLHWTLAGATANNDLVDITGVSSGTGTLRSSYLVDITSASTGTHNVTGVGVGSSDGVYSLIQNVDRTTFTLEAPYAIPDRELIIDTPLNDIDLSRNAFYFENHFLSTGTPIVYFDSGDGEMVGLTEGNTYYAIRISRDWFKLAESVTEADEGIAVEITTLGSGVQTFTTSSVAGEILGPGTVSIAEGGSTVVGQSTNFTASFNPGNSLTVYKDPTVTVKTVTSVNTTSDIFTCVGHELVDGDPVRMNSTIAPTGTTNNRIYYIRRSDTGTPIDEFTLHTTYVDAIAGLNKVDVSSAGTSVKVDYLTSLGSTSVLELRYVNSQTDMILTEPSLESFVNVEYAVGTSLLVRADGFALHRPYDGGVELIPSSNPNSQMIRQTRKYFRYQSGKGIQVSFAVNFSPTTTFDTLQVLEDQNKVTKCRRDLGYFIDGVGYDITLATNYNAVFLGIAESNSLDISPRVIQAIEDSRDEILLLSAVSSDATSTTRVTDFYTELLNIVENDRTAASDLVFTNPTDASESRIAAKDKLLANLLFIEEEINAYVASDYPDYNHDVDKCSRDIKYAVHAMCYDVLYGGNSATYDQAKFFLYSYADGTFGIIPEHIQQTVAAYERFAAIVDDIVKGVAITKSPGNALTQVTSGNNADTTEADKCVTLAGITKSTIENAEVPDIERTLPSVTWASAELQASKTAIDGAKTTILELVVPASFAFLTATATTRNSHRLTPGLQITISGATGSDAALWNDTHVVTEVIDSYTFKFSLDNSPLESSASGIVEFYVNSWKNSLLKCGLFDDQNGLYFEYDGGTLYCCRRSSTLQLSGVATVEFKSGRVLGTDTRFSSQLSEGEMIVIKGQSYVISEITSNTELYILPSYRGVTASNVVITKTIDTKIPQSDWSVDKCDGTGPLGYVLNVNRIQMAYMDYSWYGAGKVRFGFKNQNGQVVYVHEFIHNNFQTEAYMRSGNLPARYEIENTGLPTYVPALAHWGTSVIMDGRFDDDKAYVFTANSNTISVVGVATQTVSARVETLSQYNYYNGQRLIQIGYALLVATPNSAFNGFSPGIPVAGAGISAGTNTGLPISPQVSPRQPYLASLDTVIGNNFQTRAARTLLVLDRIPTIVAASASNYTVTVSAAVTPVVFDIPLISIRLSPSVDTNTPGLLGEREIINRMQLILQTVGILSTHSAEISLILNGQLNSNAWQRVTNPSLSQLIYHSPSDNISGGTVVYSFRSQGGTGTTARSAVVTTADLGEIATLGNSIMGGDGTYPNGPDVLTVVARLVEDPSTVTVTNPFNVSGRISWSESQA